MFGLSRLQGRKYVHIMHGGLHSEYAIKVKHALERHSISCFVDNCDESSRQQMQAASSESYVKNMDTHAKGGTRSMKKIWTISILIQSLCLSSRVKNCSVFVPIISHSSAKSPKLLARVEDAAGYEKIICPVILSTFALPPEIQRVRSLMESHATAGHVIERKGRGQQLAFPRSFVGLAELVNGRYFPLLRDGDAANQHERQTRVEEETRKVQQGPR